MPQPQISSASSSSLPPPQTLPQVPLPPQALPQVPPQALPQAPTQTITNAKTLPDYYGILGVEKTATWDELRRAYRKLALKWHPDKNMHQQEYAEGEFTKIAEAYEVLSDDEMRKIYDEGGSLAEACCKRKYQQSNEVGEDDDEEGFFRDPSEMYAEAMGFGAGACVAGCCGGGQGYDPFAQFRRYGIIPNGEPHDHSHDHDHDHDHDEDDYDSDEDYSSEDYEDVDEEQSVKGDPDEGEEDDKEEDANTSKTSKRAAEDDGEPQMKKRKTEAVVIVNESTNQAS